MSVGTSSSSVSAGPSLQERYERTAEGLAAARVDDRLEQAPSHDAGRPHGVRQPRGVHHLHHLDEAVLMAGAVIQGGALVQRSIVGPRGIVGRGATLLDSVLGEGVRVPAGARMAGIRQGSGRPRS